VARPSPRTSLTPACRTWPLIPRRPGGRHASRPASRRGSPDVDLRAQLHPRLRGLWLGWRAGGQDGNRRAPRRAEPSQRAVGPSEVTEALAGGGGGRALSVTQNFINPVLADRRSDTQRAAESARKLREAARNR